GQQFRFDILMDIGGFRDMHRHRRCIQIGQAFTTRHGYDTLEEVGLARATAAYEGAMKRAAEAAATLSRQVAERCPALVDKEERELFLRDPKTSAWILSPAQYVIPLAFLKRTLFKMDFAEVLYISELRTAPAGHISYRKVAYAMYEAIARKHPALARYFRVQDVRQPVDLLKR
ncbi:MAG TPA: FAD-dependent thymidylate synthase, partial [Terriglobales bacterium]|nr:FAD-dependent thymidylate synthase [Terriglobales bacterium]